MNRVIIIGAGHIGSAIGAHLELAGHGVILVPHSELELEDLASIERLFAQWPRIDMLVNAAGGYGAVGKVREIPPARWRQALDVNLVGVYACCHHALPRLVEGGHIVNIAGGGRGPMLERSGYAAAKSALWRFTETLAAEEPRIRVNAVAPGPSYSRMQQAIVGNPAGWAEFARGLQAGRGAVPIVNVLRALDHILEARPTGKLFFARDFQTRPAIVAAR